VRPSGRSSARRVAKLADASLERADEPAEPPPDPAPVPAAVPVHHGHVTLVICDSQPIFAQGLVQLLRIEAPEFEVQGVASSADELQEMAERLHPDVVLLDARFGLESARPLLSTSPLTKVILIATSDHQTDLGEAVCAGVSAYLLKEHGISDIVQVLRLALRGLLVVPEALARSTLQSGSAGLGGLDDVERQILGHIASGATNREIARRVNLSERTVRRRVIRVYGKLQVNDRVDAALYAARHGLKAATQTQMAPWGD